MLTNLLGVAIEIVRGDIEARHCKLSVALDASSYTLIVDPPRLQQVFWNVLRNACKFTSELGTVTVRSFNPSPKSIAIEISDTGIGIAPQFTEKIFDAFEQVDSRREGLGLGLAISKAIVEMHSGTIRAHREGLGKGATFTIEVPDICGLSTAVALRFSRSPSVDGESVPTARTRFCPRANR
jgi:signal transduction histidine kinase